MPYTPPNTITLDKKPFNQIRLGLQGYPKRGKTTSSLTFPGPVVADFDNNVDEANAVAAGKTMSQITIVPFYSAEFCDKIANRIKPHFPSNKRDAFLRWLSSEGYKLEHDQTLIIDSWTMLQRAFDVQQSLTPTITKTGEEDVYAFWERKLEYSESVCDILQSLKCHVVVTIHETVERNAKGHITGKMRPLMSGQFRDKLSGQFTNYFRQHAIAKKDDKGNVIGTQYLWQIHPDDIADCGTKLIGLPMFVPATYDVFVNPDKYKDFKKL